MTTADGAPPTRDFARGGYVPAPVITAADRERSLWRAGNLPPATLESVSNPHERLYAARAWIAIVRDVLIILLLLAFAFLGGRLVSAAGGDAKPAGCVEVSTGSSGTVCVPTGD
jgi:hypothetical protein